MSVKPACSQQTPPRQCSPTMLQPGQTTPPHAHKHIPATTTQASHHMRIPTPNLTLGPDILTPPPTPPNPRSHSSPDYSSSPASEYSAASGRCPRPAQLAVPSPGPARGPAQVRARSPA